MGYIFTVIGATIKLISTWFAGAGNGESAAFATTVFTVIGLGLSLIGIIKSWLYNDEMKDKLISLAIHAGIWFLVFIGLQIVLPLVIIGVVLIVVDYFFLGGTITALLYNKFIAGFSGSGVTWSAVIFSYDSEAYTLKSDLGDNAIYQNNAGNELYVSASDVGENCISTVYGDFHW